MIARRILVYVVLPLSTVACGTDLPVAPRAGSPRAAHALAPTNSPTVEIIAVGPLAVPADASSAFGADVNDAGTIVGWGFINQYLANQAFVWNGGVPANITYPTGGLFARAQALSANGRFIAGVHDRVTESRFAARWIDGQVELLPPDDLGMVRSEAFGVNDAGQVVGFVAISPYVREIPALWTNGVLADLLAGQSSGRAYDINNAGQVVGVATEGPFLWQSGTFTWLPTLPGGVTTISAINGAGAAAGRSGNRAVIWKNGSINALTDVPTGPSTWANDINDYEQVVGTQNGRAFFWEERSGFLDLGPGSAEAINNHGIVVGGPNVWTLNFAPVARVTAPTEARKKTPVTFSAEGSTDQNGDPISFTWDFGDESPNETGAIVVHEFKQKGDYTVTLSARDPRGLVGTTTHTISIENGPKPKP